MTIVSNSLYPRCTCNHCQLVDRKEESICCHEIAVVMAMNEESSKIENIVTPDCTTDNPVFQNICLNYWVLRLAWNEYRFHYGSRAYDGPEHKRQRHVAYRQFVRWCWNVLGKDIQVPLPSCAVSCIRAHYPPGADPGI